MKSKNELSHETIAIFCHELKRPILKAIYELYLNDFGGNDKTPLIFADKALRECSQQIDITLTALKTLYTDSAQSLVTLNANECIIDALADYAIDEVERKKIVFPLHKKDFSFKGEKVIFNHIIFNLLNNALKHIRNKPDSTVLISVKNRTVSVSNEIFEAVNTDEIFKQYTSSNKNHSSKNGAGLGLLYCQKAMGIFNGSIAANVENNRIIFKLVF